MPCLAMHLAVAKEYLRKNPGENEEEFMLGTIAPDIEMSDIDKYIKGVNADKNSHHFGENYSLVDETDAIEYMKRKVNFTKFFACNDLSTSFLRAYFLHLICDYLFFGEYVTYEDIVGMTAIEARDKGYADYNKITPKLIKKYDLTVPDEIKSIIFGNSEGELEILKEDRIYKFIGDMSNIDINDFENNILKI